MNKRSYDSLHPLMSHLFFALKMSSTAQIFLHLFASECFAYKIVIFTA